ncbi:MAG: Fic family protein [Candidatus Micrarchaeales archaeon]
MELNYLDILKELGVNELLKENNATDIEKHLKENITRIIFESSKYEGNELAEPIGKLLLDGKLLTHSDGFLSYIELINHKEAYEKGLELIHKKINVEDVIALHKFLTKNLFDTYAGLRRIVISVGTHISDDEKVVNYELEKILRHLNKSATSNIEVFSNMADFSTSFLKLHPFEDGNGRVCRILINVYLLKNGFLPLTVNEKELNSWSTAMSAYDSADYYLPPFLHLLTFYLRLEERQKLIEKAKVMKPKNNEARQIKDIILSITGNLSGSVLKKEISWLYDNATNEKSKLASLFLVANRMVDDAVIIKGSKDHSKNVRGMALLAMYELLKNSKIKTYIREVRHLAIDDKSEIIRRTAIMSLGFTNNLTYPICRKIIDHKIGSQELCALCIASSFSSNFKGKQKLLLSLTSNQNKNVRLFAYFSLASVTNDLSDLCKLLNNIREEPPETKFFVITQLQKAGKLNFNKIANELVETATTYEAKTLLLGLLTKEKSVNPIYSHFALQILNSKTSDNSEKAYATFLIGIAKGFDYLKSIGKSISSKNDTLENIALFLNYIRWLGNTQPGKEQLLSLNDAKLNFVEATEIGKMLSHNSYGNHFLFLYRKELGK